MPLADLPDREVNRMIHASVTVFNIEDWNKAWEQFHLVALAIGLSNSTLSIHSTDLNALEEEGNDELILIKVSNALHVAGLDEDMIQNAIDKMQRAGILFREKF